LNELYNQFFDEKGYDPTAIRALLEVERLRDIGFNPWLSLPFHMANVEGIRIRKGKKKWEV